MSKLFDLIFCWTFNWWRGVSQARPTQYPLHFSFFFGLLRPFPWSDFHFQQCYSLGPTIIIPSSFASLAVRPEVAPFPFGSQGFSLSFFIPYALWNQFVNIQKLCIYSIQSYLWWSSSLSNICIYYFFSGCEIRAEFVLLGLTIRHFWEKWILWLGLRGTLRDLPQGPGFQVTCESESKIGLQEVS